MTWTNQPYDSVFHRFCSLLMAVLLLWLTVSSPFVYQAQLDVAWEQAGGDGPDENTDPFSGTNEEKVESGTSSLSEYLHETHPTPPLITLQLNSYKSHPDDIYSAFHPELISPPPEGAL